MMNAIIAMLLAAIPNALLAIAAKLFTESFMQTLLQKLIVSAMKQAVKLSTNTIDDEIVRDIEAKLSEPPK